MAKLEGPRSDTGAYRALCRIAALGSATHADLLVVLPVKYHMVGKFKRYVVEVLASYSLVDIDDGGVTLHATKRGRQFCGVEVAPVPPVKYVGEIVPKRTHVVRELNWNRHRAVAPYRPGADDFKNIPSLYTAEVVKKTVVNEHGCITNITEVGNVIRKLPGGKVVA